MNVIIDLLMQHPRIVGHLMLEFTMNGVVQVWISIAANQAFLREDIQLGLCYTIIRILLEIFNTLYEKYVSNADYEKMDADIACQIKSYLMSQVYGKDWNNVEIILAESQVSNLIREIGWRSVAFLRQVLGFLSTFMCLGGNLIWLAWKVPTVVIIYILVLAAILYWTTHCTPDYEPINQLYRIQNFHVDMHQDAVMHHTAKSNMEVIMNYVRKINQTETDVHREDGMFRTRVSITINLITILILALINIDMTFLIVFIPVVGQFVGTVISLSQIFQSFRITQGRYRQYQAIVDPYPSRLNYDAIMKFETIEIRNLTFTRGTFHLELVNGLTFKRGEIVYITGASGHGKSSLIQLLAGEHCYTSYQADLWIDGEPQKTAFHVLTHIRYYHRQTRPSLNVVLNAGQIITQSDGQNLSSKQRQCLHQALSMAECLEFITAETAQSRKICTLSGGQKARIDIAANIYQILMHNYQIVILDEIDRQVQPHLMVKIMQNVYNWCRKHRVLCFVAAHTTEVGALVYDQTLDIHHGRISRI